LLSASTPSRRHDLKGCAPKHQNTKTPKHQNTENRTPDVFIWLARQTARQAGHHPNKKPFRNKKTLSPISYICIMNIKKERTAAPKPFYFKQFAIQQIENVMKVGTDGVLLGAWVDTNGAQTILDIGTGTGMIAIMCAQKNAEATIDAVDIEESAYLLAAENMAACPWNNRLHAFHGSVQDFARIRDISYDLIVSNPPFFTGGTFSNNEERNQMRHTVKLPSGELLQAVRRLLTKTGRFCVVLPYLEGLRFREQAPQYGLFCTRQTNVFPTPEKGIERLLLQFERTEKSMTTDQLILENNNKYTTEAAALTNAFYLFL
jgi:tRNA1Val (adenine37-N6)-methyltransferase